MAKCKVKKSKIVFSIYAPEANSVKIAGNFTDWEQNAIELKKYKNGNWKTTVSLEPGRYEYRFIVDGQWRDDPSCSLKVPNPYGSENCLLIVE